MEFSYYFRKLFFLLFFNRVYNDLIYQIKIIKKKLNHGFKNKLIRSKHLKKIKIITFN